MWPCFIDMCRGNSGLQAELGLLASCSCDTETSLASLCESGITTDILKSKRGNQRTEEMDGMVRKACESQVFCLALLPLKTGRGPGAQACRQSWVQGREKR